MIDPYLMIVLGSLFGAVLGNVGVWLYWRNLEAKDRKRFEAKMASIRDGSSVQTLTAANSPWTQEEIDAHAEGKSRYGVGIKAVQRRIDFEAGAKWDAKQKQSQVNV